MQRNLQKLTLLLCLLVAQWGFAQTRYVSPTGTDTGDCSNPAAPCQTIAFAINEAVAGNTIEIAAGTYTLAATVLINKSVTLLGTGASRPIIQGTGSADSQALLRVAATNVRIENLNIRVSQTGNALYGIRALSGANFDGIEIINNLIEATSTTPLFGSFGVFLDGSTVGASRNVSIQSNTITRSTTTGDFGRGVRLIRCTGTIGGTSAAQGNTIRGIYGLQLADMSSMTIQNNNFTAGLGVEFARPQANSSMQIINNIFTDGGVNAILLEIKDNVENNATVLIQGNNFASYQGNAIFLGRSRNVTVQGNTFTPAPAATDYVHIYINTKQRTNSALQPAFSSEADIFNNTFNGNGQAGGVGISIANSNDVCNFGNLRLGGTGTNANTFSNQIDTYIRLEALSGSSTTNPIFAGLAATNQTAVSQDFDATQNLFQVTGGTLRWPEMNFAQQTELEGRLIHRPDNAALGRLVPDPIVGDVIINSTVSNALCAGDANGSVEVSISGGAPAVAGVYNVSINSTPVQSGVTTAGVITFINLPAGTYTISANDGNGNSSTQEISIGTTSVLALTVSQDVSILRGQSTTLTASSPGSPSYTWSPAAGLNATTGSSVVASPSETTTYTVVADDGSCTASAQVTVTVLTQGRIALPNIFTPNNDGRNDTFVATGEGIQEVNFRIYNRLGQVVYQTNNVNELLNQGWDGTVNGRLQSSEAYVWVLQGKFIDGSELKTIDGKQSGTVILAR
jgi:gliding motility-associated-like protein